MGWLLGLPADVLVSTRIPDSYRGPDGESSHSMAIYINLLSNYAATRTVTVAVRGLRASCRRQP